MGTPLPAFVDHCVELLSALGAVRVRRMFGGWGFYVDDCFVALVAFERLYLKIHADTRAAFEHAGCEPFVFEAKGERVVMGYWSAPADAMDSPALMLPWARLAMQAALTARAAVRPRVPARAPRAAAKTTRRAAR